MKYSVHKRNDGFGVEDEIGMRVCVCQFEVEATRIAAALELDGHREEIERLRSENARLSAAAGERWIPVSERLPENISGKRFSEKVLALVSDGDSGGERDIIICRRALNYWECQTAIAAGITHWQPLPEPPKESEVTNE